MIADLFYPIFTLTIFILVCFMRKISKIVQGISTHMFTKALPWTPGGLQLSPRPPTSIIFGFAKNQCAHIFSVLSPAIWQGLVKDFY